MNCPLCGCDHYLLHYSKRDPIARDYVKCLSCDLVFVPRDQCLSLAEQKNIYDLHQNVPNQGYLAFLSKLASPLKAHLKIDDQGLDFGSGPGPCLHMLLPEQRLDLYDPIYHPIQKGLGTPLYSFITCTEVLEHLLDLKADLHLIFSSLRAGGLFAAMTSVRNDDRSFQRWHYHRDSTHINFFSGKTFEWLSEFFESELLNPAPTVYFLLRKERL